jgi:hypothetical protein
MQSLDLTLLVSINFDSHFFFRELVEELSKNLFEKIKELYLTFLSYKLKDEEDIKNELNNAINFIAEESKSSEKIVFPWKTFMFLKHLT